MISAARQHDVLDAHPAQVAEARGRCGPVGADLPARAGQMLFLAVVLVGSRKGRKKPRKETLRLGAFAVVARCLALPRALRCGRGAVLTVAHPSFPVARCRKGQHSSIWVRDPPAWQVSRSRSVPSDPHPTDRCDRSPTNATSRVRSDAWRDPAASGRLRRLPVRRCRRRWRCRRARDGSVRADRAGCRRRRSGARRSARRGRWSVRTSCGRPRSDARCGHRRTPEG